MKQESLLRDLVKEGLSRSIAKKITDNFPEFKDIDQLVDFACTEKGKEKLEQLLAPKSLSALNRIIEERKGPGIRPLGKGKSLSSAKTITELGEQDNPVAGTWRLPDSDFDNDNEEDVFSDDEMWPLPDFDDGINNESLSKHYSQEIKQQKNLLYSTLAINGVSEDILELIVETFPFLRDFSGLFQMAYKKIAAEWLCSILTQKDISELNELFYKKYNCRPLPEKKKRGRHQKVLDLAVVDAPC